MQTDEFPLEVVTSIMSLGICHDLGQSRFWERNNQVPSHAARSNLTWFSSVTAQRTIAQSKGGDRGV